MARQAATAPRRALHPVAWWLWAGCMAVAAFKTTNPVLLLLVAAVVAFVVSAKHTSAPWSRSLAVFLRLGLVVVVIRVGIEVLFGQRLPGHVVFALPHVPLPAWAAGVSVGGPVTVESVLQAAVDGLRLAVVLVCFGAANSLASPYRLLRCLPAVLYEAGLAVTVALTFAPELVMTIASVRETRRLRGRPTRGVAGLRGMAIPVLEGAFERSLALASSMDSRGYGRRGAVEPSGRRIETVSIAGGLLLVMVGIYGVLDPGSLPAGGVPIMVIGAVMLAWALVARGRRTLRTRYRRDPWRLPEWGVSFSGLVAALSMAVATAVGVAGVQIQLHPLRVPAVPVVAVAGVLVGLLPALVAPGNRRARLLVAGGNAR
jgi:energy-coupling factor transport system permease protein